MSRQLRELIGGNSIGELQHEMLDEFTVFAFPSRSLRQAKTSINSMIYAVNSSVLRLSSVDCGWVGFAAAAHYTGHRQRTTQHKR
jgi:hypothetical protein